MKAKSRQFRHNVKNSYEKPRFIFMELFLKFYLKSQKITRQIDLIRKIGNGVLGRFIFSEVCHASKNKKDL